MSINNLVYYNHLLLFMSNSNLTYYNLTKSSVDRDKIKNKGKNIFLKKLKIAGRKCRDKPETNFCRKKKSQISGGFSCDNEVPSHFLPVNFSSFKVYRRQQLKNLPTKQDKYIPIIN